MGTPTADISSVYHVEIEERAEIDFYNCLHCHSERNMYSYLSTKNISINNT
jgi:hypothetical protein